MEASRSEELPNPKRLKTLAASVECEEGNLLHKFVLDNSPPNPSLCERDLNGHLRTLSGTTLNVNALNDDGYSPLHLAVLHGNPLMVKKLLSCLVHIDVDLECNDGSKNTALHMAMKSCDLDIVQELLNQGADAKVTNEDGDTALHLAVEMGDVSIAQELVEKGADVNAGKRLTTPLHAAALSGHVACLEFLLSQGAYLYTQDLALMTALSCAAQEGHLAAVEFLANKGLDPHAARQSLQKAAQHGHLDVLQFLLGRVPDVDMSSLLLCAAESGSMETVQFVADKGADVNTRDALDRTPLHVAVKELTSFAVFNCLVRRGADLNAKDQYGRTPLHFAIYYHKLQTVEWLITEGADVNARCKKNQTPLHIAIFLNKIQCAEWLISKGTDVNVRDAEGKTALHYTAIKCSHESIEMTKLLIEAGGDVNAKDTRGGFTPLHHLLRRYDRLYIDSNGPCHAKIKLLLKAVADVNIQDRNGETPLHCVMQWRCQPLMKLFTEQASHKGSEN